MWQSPAQEIVAMRAEKDKPVSEAEQCASQTSALNERITATEQELHKAKSFVADTNRTLGYFQAMLAQRRFDFDQASKRILELEARLEHLPREAEARVERATREAEAQIERLTREAWHDQQRLLNFEQSTCWRITRPLRVIKLTLAHYGLVSKSSPVRWFR